MATLDLVFPSRNEDVDQDQPVQMPEPPTRKGRVYLPDSSRVESSLLPKAEGGATRVALGHPVTKSDRP